MTPIGPHHNSVVDRLNRFWVRQLGDRAIVRVQGSVVAGPRSEPEPDLAVLRERSDFYRHRQPGPQDILLIIEVAESSIDYDHAKLSFYAAAGITEVWIVDLSRECLEIHRDPRDGGYTDVRVLRGRETATCLAFSDVSLTVADILG
jgi:Uma2 family endonuclease